MQPSRTANAEPLRHPRSTPGRSLRVLLAVLLAGGACVGAGLVMAAPAHAVKLTSTERHLLALVNATRKAHGLPRLRPVASLERAARAHSRQMVAKDFFGHASYGGESFAARIVRLGYTNAGYSSWTAGEDIAYGSGSAGTAKAIFRAWMHSTPHRRVILTRKYRDAGVGRASGTYAGVSGVVFFTLDCGARSK
jgi:uncharacterized protein YkwD